MTLGERLGWLGRAQEARSFKIAATALIVLAAAGLMIAFVFGGPAAERFGGSLSDEELSGMTEAQKVEARSDLERINRSIERLLEAKGDTTLAAVTIGVSSVLLAGAVWMGLGLTYLAVLLGAGAVVLPLLAFESTRDWARLLGGVFALSLSFVTLMRGANLLLSGPWAVTGIARNVLVEASRQRVSLVFFVLLVFGLAALPGMLDDRTALRYRVQSFLQFGTGGSFWIIAVLVVLFSVSTVATEQRGKVIWQTMTKPVSAWSYVLGKWLGVSVLALVLLSVSGTGVFLFTEYLRGLPALNETGPFQSKSGVGVTEDRRVLESQVLAARVAVDNEPLNMASRDPEYFRGMVDQYIAEIKRSNPNFDDRSEAQRREVLDSLNRDVELQYRVIPAAPPGSGIIGSQTYRFAGLSAPRDQGRPVTFRYRIDSGSNRPDLTYKLTFMFRGFPPISRDVVLGQFHVMDLPPTVIDAEGNLTVTVYNGGFVNETIPMANPSDVSFPKGGLEVSYSRGGYRMNFVRVMVVLWVKLVFLAIIGICAATFLSFSVASLVAFGVFLSAESSGYLAKSLETYDDMDHEGNVVWAKWVAVRIAEGVTWLFQVYADLRPTQRLVDGILLSWGHVAFGLVVLAAASGVIYWIAGSIFKRRELAMYSGQ
ncbi:MAG: hypothetical protein HRU70_06235 [Phycisphaeraceae bacterium]|nr:MAG: hypothetical protein HRU70_06235 [Phycisphaeraceae bacterium]